MLRKRYELVLTFFNVHRKSYAKHQTTEEVAVVDNSQSFLTFDPFLHKVVSFEII